MPSSPRPSSLRAFVAIPLALSLLHRIQAEQERLQHKFGTDSIRWIAAGQIHLTLRFYGNVPTEEIPTLQLAISRATGGSRAFELTVEGLGCFPSYKNPKVIWLGLGGDLDALAEVQRQVESETRPFGSHSEERPFHPHLTIGRTKALGAHGHHVGQVLRSEPGSKLSTWRVSNIHLIQSQLRPQGSVYTVLAEFALGVPSL